MELSKQAQRIVGSITLAIDAKAKAMIAAGQDVIGFGAGEPDFDTPEFIKQAAKDALDAGKTKYTPSAGTLELRQAICDKLKKDNGLAYTPAQVIVSNGAKHSLYNAFQALLDPGDEVIIPAPYWVSYPEMVKMCYGTPVIVNGAESDGFKARVEALEAAVTNKTKAIVVNSPSNPSGCVYRRDELAEIARLAVKKDIFIISDEIYEKLIYDGNEHVSIASFGEEIYQRTVTVNGLSKSYAMTGWRMGYAAAPKPVADVMNNCQSHATSNPNTIAQYASLAAFQGDARFQDRMIAEFDRRRRAIAQLINAIPGLSCLLPAGAFYVMMNISRTFGKSLDGRAVTDSMTFAELLLEAQKVAVVPGVAFGAEGFVRMSYATSMQKIEAGLARIARFAGNLKA